MVWSQLKKRVEAGFAESVTGCVEIFRTHYHKTHDDEGEIWITLDKKRVLNFAEYKFLNKTWKIKKTLPQEAATWQTTYAMAEAEGYFSDYRWARAMKEVLNLSIDKILASEDSLVRALGMLDKRFGKRRIQTYDVSNENEAVKVLYRIRLEAEGLSSLSQDGGSAEKPEDPHDLGIELRARPLDDVVDRLLL